MSKTVAIAVSMALIGVPAALAQHKTTGGSSDPAATQSSPYINAPVGHRQPRPSEIPAESTKAWNPDQIDPADAALDRKIKSICRGC
ncbi:hypothetical protein V4R08_03380 [Nitrobacter sp. NHB1]|uniref:hypothetical protein n=1 Tax=Nitrobacter sp. NHB1 TaxID=3119830 RepID=UPI0030003C8E